jgi:nucleoside 2-deoxyribosyltransferase
MPTTIKYIYIASPYTIGSPEENVNRSLDAAEEVLRMGLVPFCPLLTHYWDLYKKHTYQEWLTYDLEWLKKCDAVLRLPGISAGADTEVKFAHALEKPVYYSLQELKGDQYEW